MKRQDLDKGRQICSDAELLAGDRHGEISAKRSPQLESDCVGCRAIKYPNPQAVFEPAKEQFDLPAVTIQLGDDSGVDCPLIGPKSQTAGVLKIVEADAAQKSGPVLGCVSAVESDRLVGAQVGGAVNPAGSGDIVTHVGTISDDKEGPGLGDASQATKVDVAAVHDVKGTGLDRQLIEPADIAESRGSDVEKRGDRAAQIERGVELYRRVGAGPVGPRAKCETQIYYRGVYGDDRHVEIERIGFVKIQCPDFGHEFTGQMLPRPPVALFIGAGQGTPSDPGPEAHVIRQSDLRVQTRLNIPQALAKSHLRKPQRQKVVPRRESVAARSWHPARCIRTLKLPVRNTRHDLGEDGLTGVHQASDRQRRPPGSNREQALKASTPCKNAAYITPLVTKWDSIAPPPPNRGWERAKVALDSIDILLTVI